MSRGKSVNNLIDVRQTVFHTVRYSEDTDTLLRNAPFLCKDRPGELKEWLGDGYYFWEKRDQLAHWWGKVRYRRKGEHYIICRTVFDCPDNEFLDLIGNSDQIEDVREVVELMRLEPSFDATQFTAQAVIHFLRTRTPFPYKAIRAYGRDCSADPEVKKYILPFSRHSSMHLSPEYQICVIDKSVIDLPMELYYSSKEEELNGYTV